MFDERLRKLREERGLSARQVAKNLGIPYTTYLGYERDEREPSAATLVKLHALLDVSLDYLLGVSPCKSTDPDLRQVCRATGLSEKAVARLFEMKEEAQRLPSLSDICAPGLMSLALECPEADLLFTQLQTYCMAVRRLKEHGSPSLTPALLEEDPDLKSACETLLNYGMAPMDLSRQAALSKLQMGETAAALLQHLVNSISNDKEEMK